MTTFIFSDIKTGEQVFTFIGDKAEALAWMDTQPDTFLWWAGNIVLLQAGEPRIVAGLRYER